MPTATAIPLSQRWATQPFTRAYRTRRWRWPAGYAEAASWQRTSFANAQGVRLAGLFRPAAGRPRGIVVCAHPLRRDAKGFFLRTSHAAMLRQSGYHVLLFDFNGFGESARGGCLYPLDVVAAGHHAARLAPGLPVGVLGVSFGAAWAACALADPCHNFDAAVLENPFTTLPAYFARHPVHHRILRALCRWMPREAAALSPAERLRAACRIRSLLLIYGENDLITPPAAGSQLLQSLPEKQRSGGALWIVPGAGHNEAVCIAPRAYRRRVADVFGSALVRRGSVGETVANEQIWALGGATATALPSRTTKRATLSNTRWSAAPTAIL